MKRVFSIFLAIVITAVLMTGCKNSGKPSGDDAAKDLALVELDWYCVADPIHPDVEEVWAALNDYAKEKINATINFHWYTTADYYTKMTTMLTAGQKMDLLYVRDANLSYSSYVKKGAFHPIEKLLPELAPKTYANLTKGLIDAVTIDGHIYAVPHYKDIAQRYSLLYNSNLAQEIGVDFGIKWKTMRDLMPLLEKAKVKRDKLHPDWAKVPVTALQNNVNAWYPCDVINGLAVTNVPGVDAYKGMGSGEKVFNMYATDEYKEMCKQIKAGVEKGIFPYDYKNVNANTLMANGQLLAMMSTGYVTIAPDRYSKDYETKLSNSDYSIMYSNYILGNLTAVSSTTANPERAVMLLELLNSDEHFATTLRFGIEGKHYNRNEKRQIYFSDSPRNSDSKKYGYYYWYGAPFGSLLTTEVPATQPESDKFIGLLKELNDKSNQKTNLGFIFDTSPVVNEIAACSSVIAEYDEVLKSGMLENIDAGIAEFQAKLNASGAQKIVNEAQTQLTKWRTSVGK